MKGSTTIWEKSTTPVVTPDYLYIQNTYAGTNDITFTKPDDENTKTLEYSKDLSNWTSFTPKYDITYKVTLNQGEKLYLRGSNGTRPNLEIWGQRSHIAGGNVNTLLDYTNPNGVSLPQKAFKSLFNGDLYLTDASNLVLPATRLSNYCYSYMFYTCTSLTTAPTLPATTLAQYCYGNMFWGCSSLTTAPTLPATTLTSACYQYMFRDCRALTTTPSLTATNLTNATACYQGMFQGCTSLTTTPSLPATTLASGCYDGMFYNCTSLTTTPSLPATTLTSACYQGMFSGCTSLITTPSLPATNLADFCYNQMFRGCTSLTTAPSLPATTLKQSCYANMFKDCTSLNEVTTYAEDISASNCLTDWLNSVAATGTFYNNGSATYPTNSASGIPSGWTEVKPSTGPDYFYIENVDSNSGNVSFKFDGTPSSDTIQQIEWSKDKTNWTPVTLVANTTTNVPVSVGEKVYFRNSNGKFSIYMYYFTFGGDVLHDTGGDINTLLDYTTDATTLSINYIFARLFKSDIKLRKADNLTLGYTTLKDYCYENMFNGCTSLTTAPELPATTLAYGCYSDMFFGCSSLTTIPSTLPATTLETACYKEMFNGCKSITTAPELPASTLVLTCYFQMFQGCTSLNSVTIYANDISATYSLNNWLSGVASTGTFYNYGSATYPTNSPQGIPRGWTEVRS